jgi:hypothetical protein
VESPPYNFIASSRISVKASESNSEWLTRKRLIDPKLKLGDDVDSTLDEAEEESN